MGKTFLKWKKVDKVTAYKIEIQSSNGKIKSFIEKNTELYIDLNQGKYTYRVGAVNKLGKVKVWSSWEPLNIIYTSEPVVSDIRYRFTLPAKDKEIIVAGEYFLEDIEMSLSSKSEKVQFKNFKRINENEIRFEIPLEDAVEETITLTLTNPLNKVTTIEKYISLIGPKPKIEKGLKYIIDLPTSEKEIIIRGNFFSDKIDLKLTMDNRSIPFANFERVSEKEIKLTLPLKGFTANKIQLTLKNSDTRVTTIEDFIELRENGLSRNNEIENSGKVRNQNYELGPPLWRSMVFPGWGQYYKQENTKAVTFGASTVFLLGAIYYFESEKKAALNRSDAISNRLFLLPGEASLLPVALYFRNQSSSFTNEAEDWNRRQEIGIGLLVGVYAYNIFDIYKNHNTKIETNKTGFYFNGNLGKASSNIYFGYTFEF